MRQASAWLKCNVGTLKGQRARGAGGEGRRAGKVGGAGGSQEEKGQIMHIVPA